MGANPDKVVPTQTPSSRISISPRQLPKHP